MKFPARFRLPPTPIERVLSPFSRFMRQEAAGGIVLIACAIAAFAWANSPWASSYHHLLETEVGLRFGPWTTVYSLHHWINDGLMAVFFFLVGLEIKREVLAGELASPRRAALPAAAALGGMVVPALLYAVLNAGSEGSRGWGIPMATDIAFVLGVMALMGPRVPVALKVFLTALAIVDDIGAVLVIAAFYTGEIRWPALGAGLLLLALLAVANRLGMRRPLPYVFVGIAVWAFFLVSGVHATVAGVLLAFTIPGRTRIDCFALLAHGRSALKHFEAAAAGGRSVLGDPAQHAALLELEEATEAAQAPLQRIEHELQAPVAFVVVPLFALANAGVTLSGGGAAAATHPVALGIVLGLVLGKPIGITLFSWLAVRLRAAELPEGVRWSQLLGVSCLGGIGFTMSLFIAALAFPSGPLGDVAKIGTFAGSLLAVVVGWLMLSRAARPRRAARKDEPGTLRLVRD